MRAALGLSALLASAALLSACASPSAPAPSKHAEARIPTEQYPLQAEGRPHEILLAPHADGLSQAQAAALADVASRWREAGGGDIVIREPLSGVDPRVAAAESHAAQGALAAFGIPPEHIRHMGYDPGGQASPAVVVAFVTYEAVTPSCGRDWDNLANSTQNRTSSNFGCAVSANMAAQIADPADITAPRASDPADATRRTTVLGKYRLGVPTGAADKEANITVSGVASGGGP